MAWTYKDFANQDVTVILDAIVAFLNEIRSANLNVKFDACNQYHGDARGVVFYQSGEGQTTEAPHAPAAATISWNQYTWYSETDYKYLYDKFTEVLNTRKLPNGTYLSDSQVSNSRVVYTNQHSGDATLSIYYPSV